MPVPTPKEGEKQDAFMERCMHEVSKNPDRTNKQNVAICLSKFREKHPSAKKPPERATTLKLPVQFRKIESGEIDREKRTVSLSFSSTARVKRTFGYEMLSHDPKAIDTKRLDSGGVPLLLNHDWNKQVGRV
jgi:hypothetical protein